MLARIWSAAARGIEGFLVGVEIDVAEGLPAFRTVGLPDRAIREARDRLVAAIRHSGFEFPARRVTVNLAPAELRKDGSHLDLPIALGLLAASGQAPGGRVRDLCFLGELALDGSVRPVSGVLAMASALRAAGLKGAVVPRANRREAAAAGLTAYGVSDLREAAGLLGGRLPPEEEDPAAAERRPERPAPGPDLSEVRGQALARRALEAAAAGGHNLLLIGPPGAGKSMLAARLPGILPDMTDEESLEVTKIFSAAGQLEPGGGLVRRRPFRAPHATSTAPALAGGGPACRPGEISLAHRGVLFLDELPEFSRPALEALRQPLEDRRIAIARARDIAVFPADFMLVAAMNPCPCGWLGCPDRACRCPEPAVARYRSRVSGPLLDRIDLQVELAPLPFAEWSAGADAGPAEDSRTVARRVGRARAVARERNRGVLNAALTGRSLRRLCAPGREGMRLLESAARRRGLSARALDRLLRVARTIADLAGAQGVEAAHVAEALQYRALDAPGG